MGSEVKRKNSLYVRLPVKIVDEHQILELHPKISIVHLPRQKSRRWCTIEFTDQSVLKEVRTALKKIKIEGRAIKVKPLGIPKKVRRTTNKFKELKESLE